MIRKVLAISFAIYLAQPALRAESNSLYYWDNQSGLKSANHCQLTTTKKTNFSFEIENGSLVKTINTSGIKENSEYEIVGTNPKTSSNVIRGDKVLLKEKNLDPINNRVIQINKDLSNFKAGSLWKVQGDNEYLKLSCPEFDNKREYIIFNVYPKDGGKSIAQVGVYWDETKLFSNISTYTLDQAYSLNPEIRDDETTVLDQIKMLSGKIIKASTKVPTDSISKDVVKSDPLAIKSENSNIIHQDGLDMVVCTSKSSVNIRNDQLDKIIFTAKAGEKLKIFQGWGENTKDTMIDGEKYTFQKVQFVGREEADQQIGFIASGFVKAKSDCLYDSTQETKPTPTVILSGEGNNFGLNASTCCTFPTTKMVTTPFTEGMRRFGWPRNGGDRVHAAVDLYRYKDEPLLAVAPGVVIRGLYFFYLGTYAIEVVHVGGFVVRYGEVTGNSPEGLMKGVNLSRGDRVGYMGQVNTGCCEPMLHFELYKGTMTGPLSQDGVNPVDGKRYNRRNDLLNPTPYLLKWQNEQFKK